MKHHISLLCAAALLTTACNKGTVNTFPEGSSYANAGLTYQEIRGSYRMYDSIHYIGNQGYQPIDDKFKYPLSTDRDINIAIENGVGVFMYHNQKFVESRGVMNEYMAYDTFFDITKIRFNKDSIFVNYFKRTYRNDSCLNITVRGYKLK